MTYKKLLELVDGDRLPPLELITNDDKGKLKEIKDYGYESVNKPSFVDIYDWAVEKDMECREQKLNRLL